MIRLVKSTCSTGNCHRALFVTPPPYHRIALYIVRALINRCAKSAAPCHRRPRCRPRRRTTNPRRTPPPAKARAARVAPRRGGRMSAAAFPARYGFSGGCWRRRRRRRRRETPPGSGSSPWAALRSSVVREGRKGRSLRGEGELRGGGGWKFIVEVSLGWGTQLFRFAPLL